VRAFLFLLHLKKTAPKSVLCHEKPAVIIRFYSATIKAISYAFVGNREPKYRIYWDTEVQRQRRFICILEKALANIIRAINGLIE
jgi:hypothetical protein